MRKLSLFLDLHEGDRQIIRKTGFLSFSRPMIRKPLFRVILDLLKTNHEKILCFFAITEQMMRKLSQTWFLSLTAIFRAFQGN